MLCLSVFGDGRIWGVHDGSWMSRYLNAAAAARSRLQQASDFFRNHERRPVASIAIAQQPLRFFIADNLLRAGIEVDRPA